MINTNVVLQIILFIIITSILGYYYKSRDDDFQIESFNNFNNYEKRDNCKTIYDKFYSISYKNLKYHKYNKKLFDILIYIRQLGLYKNL